MIASESLKSVILGPGGGRMTITSRLYEVREVLQTYAVFLWLTIYHNKGGPALKSHCHNAKLDLYLK